MNSNTRDKLKEFISSIEDLAGAVQTIIGTQAASDIVQAAEDLKHQLDSDETIAP